MIKSIDILKNKMVKLECEFNALGDKLELLADFDSGKYYDEEKAKEFYKTKREYEEKRKEVNDILYKIMDIENKNKVKNNKNTFINSFGEATKRYITNSTYEKHQKRLSKEVLNFISK